MKWPSFFKRKKKEKEKKGRDLVKVVTEKVSIRENRIAILEGIRVHLRWLLATILVMIGVPVAFFIWGKSDGISPLISVLAGIASFYLGYRALTKIKQVYSSTGG
jgi:hypothetical protein